MRLLLDTCVWGGAVRQLADLGHDVIWSGMWETDPGDQEILRIAHQEQRVLVTQDKDFGELAIVRRLPHSGIIRLVGIPARRQAEYAHYVVERYGHELSRQAIATIDLYRLRIRAEGNTWSVPE